MPEEKNTYSRELLTQLLYSMLLIRRFEERAAQAYGLKKIGGFCHLYIGEEAVAVGAIKTLDLARDYVVSAYRDHGHALACGMDPGVVMAELYGKKTGCSGGKGGSMHLYDADRHMLGGNGIVGGQIPVATGAGFKVKYKNEDGVVLCFFGDGAIHMGSFHESLNMASIWNLPVIYICENNQYGMGTDYRRVSAVDEFSLMGASYNIPGRRINGMDVLEVYGELSRAVKKLRKSPAPLLFEIKTYRYKGHSMSDPGQYRTREELEEFKAQDPLLILRKKMNGWKILTDAEYQQLDDRAGETAAGAAQFAEQGEEPPLSALYEDVFA